MCTWDILNMGHYLHYLYHSWSLVTQQGENTDLCPSTENWVKDLLSLAPPIRIRPSFPFSQYLLSGSFLKSHPYPSESRQNENYNHRKLINLIPWTTALCNSMKLWAMPCRGTQNGWKVLTKYGPLEKAMANHFSILALRTPWTIWKGKRYAEKWTPQVSRCPICYWRRVEK